MNRLFALTLATMIALAGCLGHTADVDDGDEPAQTTSDWAQFYEELAQSTEWQLDTTSGQIRMILYDAWLPNTTARIAELTNSGFYDNTQFHRVIDDFVIQGGDPTATGTGGSGETMVREWDPRLVFGPGSVGMARDADPDSADSQFYIVEKAALHLSDPNATSTADFGGVFTLFGQVIDGMHVVRDISDDRTSPTVTGVGPGLDRPVVPIIVTEARTDLLQQRDLLQLPRYAQLIPEEQFVPPQVFLDLPLNVFAGHAATVTVAQKAGSDAWAQDLLELTFENDSGDNVTAALVWDATDELTWEGEIEFPAAGLWQMKVGNFTNGVAIDVHPWHDDLAKFS